MIACQARRKALGLEGAGSGRHAQIIRTRLAFDGSPGPVPGPFGGLCTVKDGYLVVGEHRVEGGRGIVYVKCKSARFCLGKYRHC